MFHPKNNIWQQKNSICVTTEINKDFLIQTNRTPRNLCRGLRKKYNHVFRVIYSSWVRYVFTRAIIVFPR